MYILLNIILSIAVDSGYAQNLVPNPSFEQYVTCPTLYEQVYLASPWFQPNTVSYIGTMYYNQCTSNTNISVPNNINGYQNAKTGNAYAGIGWLYFYGSANGGRQYLEIRLDSILTPGKKYLVSFYASLTDDSKYATDAVGVYFSQDSVLYHDSLTRFLPLIPQVKNNSNNIISDTSNWVLISGEYIAQGGEQFITIGNFYPDSVSSIDTVNSEGTEWAAYYIDDVSVMADTATGMEELQKGNMKFKVYPNPTENEITIEYIPNKEQATLELYNLIGEQVGSYKLDKENNRKKISLLNYEAGIYFYQIILEGKIISEEKLIIIKR